MSNKTRGTTQNAGREGVALLTVHSSKGLEFDVVFVAGMADGSFPRLPIEGGSGIARGAAQYICRIYSV